MKRKKAVKWSLPSNEVNIFGHGLTKTNRKKLTKSSRSIDKRNWEIKLLHIPTVVEVKGEV